MAVEKASEFSVFMVAGEASADVYGAAVLSELKRRRNGIRCLGIGGAHLEAAGMELVARSEEISAVGFEWLGRAQRIWGIYQKACRSVTTIRPDVAVLIDLPDFNLMLAKRLKAVGVPVVYYISPQVWAWRKYRIRKIRSLVDKMLVIFPFERDFYERQGVPVDFVGHPLVDEIKQRGSYRVAEEIKKAPRVALLPGSRPSELYHHANLLREVTWLLRAKYPGLTVRVPVAPTLPIPEVVAAFSEHYIEVGAGTVKEVVSWADIALVASGTATLETALLGTPFCLFYRINWLTGIGLRYVVRYRNFFGMPNLLHGREVVKEFFQEKATPQVLFEEACRLIENDGYRRTQVAELSRCREKLGYGGANARVASIVLHLLESHVPRKALAVPELA